MSRLAAMEGPPGSFWKISRNPEIQAFHKGIIQQSHHISQLIKLT